MGIRRTFRFMWLALLLSLAFAAFASPVTAQDSASLIPLTTLPTEHILSGMPAYAQHWGLTCEYAATSAATWYYGNQISETTFINNIGFDANPNKGFRGRLNGPWVVSVITVSTRHRSSTYSCTMVSRTHMLFAMTLYFSSTNLRRTTRW